MALTSVAQLLGHSPAKRKVAGSTPGQGTRLGYKHPIAVRLVPEAHLFSHTSMFPSLSFSSPSPLSQNKQAKSLKT